MAVENLTTYTETDPESQLTVTSTTVTQTAVRTGANCRVSKDAGAGHFGNFSHNFEVSLTSQSGADALLGVYAVSNTLGGYDEFGTDDIAVYWYRNVGTLELWLERKGIGSDSNAALSQSTIYYCTLLRDATNLQLLIYSNSGRTTLVDTLSITRHATTLRYAILSFAHYTTGSGTSNTSTGSVANLDLGEGGGGASTGTGGLASGGRLMRGILNGSLVG